MFTRNDLIDLIARHLAKAGAERESAPARGKGPIPMLPKGRLFLSEYEIKKRLTADAQELRIPKEAILSPLATDWLILKGIKIVKE